MSCLLTVNNGWYSGIRTIYPRYFTPKMNRYHSLICLSHTKWPNEDVFFFHSQRPAPHYEHTARLSTPRSVILYFRYFSTQKSSIRCITHWCNVVNDPNLMDWNQQPIIQESAKLMQKQNKTVIQTQTRYLPKLHNCDSTLKKGLFYSGFYVNVILQHSLYRIYFL